MQKTDYNRFPTSGLLWQYKPFILSETRKYANRYWLPFDVVLDHAVDLAAIAETRFDPGRINPATGRPYDFSTFLRWHLMGLNRLCQKEHLHQTLHHVGRIGAWTLTPEKQPTDRYKARLEYGDYERGRISWEEHTPALLDLDQHQKNSLRLIEKAVLDWMIEPDGRTLSQVAEWIGVTKGYASKIRYQLLHKSHALPVIVAA